MTQKHKNAVNYPYITCDGETFNLADMNRDELLQLKNRLDTDMTNIQYQMDMADAGSRVTERSDPRWWAAIKYVRSTKAQQVQAIQNEISRRKKTEIPPLCPYFMDVCRDRLSGETFNLLYEEAHRRWAVATIKK